MSDEQHQYKGTEDACQIKLKIIHKHNAIFM